MPVAASAERHPPDQAEGAAADSRTARTRPTTAVTAVGLRVPHRGSLITWTIAHRPGKGTPPPGGFPFPAGGHGSGPRASASADASRTPGDFPIPEPRASRVPKRSRRHPLLEDVSPTPM
ncbi:hypothetical protein GCM10010156_04010 [Planobispora rosea]|uniref:Uncharacterized protein n=1 Tax=Planobispora rosea TaxID=35762 RepID=A0A8J3WD99_PLARO|nr:hypothetical protein GCM10010156_04010 [Planobispora rosea]GIH83686.1 hypothetical protein Pro02_20940 [Planobispora rosea]